MMISPHVCPRCANGSLLRRFAQRETGSAGYPRAALVALAHVDEDELAGPNARERVGGLQRFAAQRGTTRLTRS